MKKTLGVLVAILIAFAGGYLVHTMLPKESGQGRAQMTLKEVVGALRALPAPAPEEAERVHELAKIASKLESDLKVQIWTCSMHPQIRQHVPGNCPICGMTLIPLETEKEAGPRQLVTTEEAKQLMNIRVAPVERRFVTAEIRMLGKVDYDETKLSYITAWVGGRLDRLFVDYTGVPVKKGDHMVVLYSPQLLTAQEELLQAKQAIKDLERSNIDIMKENARATLEASREKLRLWGLSADQIQELEKRGKATTDVQINAPVSGIVISKDAKQGMYVDTGTRIYTIADLSGVWVKLDAYESDLEWVRYGQKVTFTSDAYPGQEFVGIISFIDPVVDPMTRTVKIRVEVPNRDGKLKPDMFVHGLVRAQLAAGGRVVDPDLAGKWICYMHPSVIKDAPGNCDLCGMPLVRTESLGYVPVDEANQAKPLVIPVSAALVTGKRAIVYVELPGAEHPTFEGREVQLGPRAGSYYIVKSGLKEGDLVVVEGNFKIDSALQLQAKPSMMMPEGGRVVVHEHGEPGVTTPPPVVAGPTFKVPKEFKKQLARVWEAYMSLSAALAADDFKSASESVDKTRKNLDAVDMKLLDGDAHVAWMKASANLGKVAGDLADAKEIEGIRRGFALFSEEFVLVIKTFGIDSPGPVYKLHCPMAFNNRGADWLQNVKEVHNPYFGAAMPKCGDVVETIPTEPQPQGAAP